MFDGSDPAAYVRGDIYDLFSLEGTNVVVTFDPQPDGYLDTETLKPIQEESATQKKLLVQHLEPPKELLSYTTREFSTELSKTGFGLFLNQIEIHGLDGDITFMIRYQEFLHGLIPCMVQMICTNYILILKNQTYVFMDGLRVI